VPKLASNISSNTAQVTVDSATPAALGYRMPAEWEPHEAIWMAWPHYRGDWPGKFEPIPWVYAEIIRNLAPHERVELVVADTPAERQARKLLERADVLLTNVRFHHWPTNRVWMRDSGCIFVTPQEPGFAQPDSREPARSAEALSEAEGLPKGRHTSQRSPSSSALMPGPNTLTGDTTKRSAV